MKYPVQLTIQLPGSNRLGGPATEHQIGRAIAVNNIHEVVHDHVVQAGRRSFCSPIRTAHPTRKFPVCGVNQVPYVSRNQFQTSVSLVPSKRRATCTARLLTGRAAPPSPGPASGRDGRGSAKNVPEPATRFTSRPGYSVISACAVSIAVLPPPMIHTGVSLARHFVASHVAVSQAKPTGHVR